MALTELDMYQYDRAMEAMVFAFPSYDDLNIMMRSKLGKRLSAFAAPDAMPVVMDKLFVQAESKGWIDDLLVGALKHNPESPYLKNLLPVVMLQSQGAPAETLQGMVFGANALIDIGEWRDGLTRIEKSVCRFQVIDKETKRTFGVGTGFLIADDVLMTNRHVVDFLVQPRASVPAAQFDYVTGTDDDRTPSGGTVIPLEGGVEGIKDWLIGSSPVNELDYALIRLPAGTGRPVTPTPQAYSFSAGDVYFIPQHPKGETMKIGGGTMLGKADNPPRINYTTNTETGSSGSPVFTTSWQPVALHRAGSNTHNSGVPLSIIYEHAKANGYDWPAAAA